MQTILLFNPLASPPPSGCVPGRDGIPASPVGHLMCGDYLTHLPATLRPLVQAYWPLLVAVAVALIAARAGWLLWRRRAWRHAVREARWLNIVPPVSATPAATLALWQLLATLLPAARRLTVRPGRLVWEVHATPTGMRCGLWVPPGINPTAVLRALDRAWPGVRVAQTLAPALGPQRPTSGLALTPTQPEWLPLVEDPTPPTMRPTDLPLEQDRIRAVFAGLAAAGRTGAGLLQVHVARAPRHRVAVLRRAVTNPRRARRRGRLAVLVVAAEGLRGVLSGALDVLTPGLSRVERLARVADPLVAEQARHARSRYADAPHLLVAIRATAAGPSRGAARAAVADITSGFSLLSPHWRRRRIPRPANRAGLRWVPQRAMGLATVAETAMLAGLPMEPSTYGLPAAASRRLTATRDVFTTPLTAERATPARRPATLTAQDAAERADDDDSPTMWSTP